MFRIAWVGLCVVVAACAGDSIKKGLTSLQGQPLSAAIAVLGVPSDERMIAGQKVYTWHTGSMVRGTDNRCQIRVITAADVINAWDFEGQEAACSVYAAKFGR